MAVLLQGMSAGLIRMAGSWATLGKLLCLLMTASGASPPVFKNSLRFFLKQICVVVRCVYKRSYICNCWIFYLSKPLQPQHVLLPAFCCISLILCFGVGRYAAWAEKWKRDGGDKWELFVPYRTASHVQVVYRVALWHVCV